MKKILKITAIFLIMAGSFYSCEKNNDIDMSKIDFSNIESLYEQPLPVIQKCVQGKWEVKCIYGGLVGLVYVDDEFIEINGNNFNGNEFQWVKYTVQNLDGSPFQTYAVQYKGLEEPDIYFGSIKNDSLNVVRILSFNCYDCFTGQLWVRSE